MLYTGGTTGMPKGVMWRQHDLYRLLSEATMHDPDEPDLDAVRNRLTRPGPITLPACPLMHGTGAFSVVRHPEPRPARSSRSPTGASTSPSCSTPSSAKE